MRRVLLVANPASRRGTRLRAAAHRAFSEAGVACDTALTEHRGHAAEICRDRAAGYDAVFTLGGDGTAMEVIGALANSGQIDPGNVSIQLARWATDPSVDSFAMVGSSPSAAHRSNNVASAASSPITITLALMGSSPSLTTVRHDVGRG